MDNQTVFTHTRGTRITLTLSDVKLSRGLACYCLDADIQWQLTPVAGLITISGFTGAISAFARGAFYRLAPAAPLHAAQAPDSSIGPSSGALTLRAYVSPGQVEALEEARNGGDLLFDIELGVTFFDVDDRRAPGVHHGNLRLTIEQSRWLKRLESASYARTLLLEVPAFEPDGDPDHASAVDFFNRSRVFLDKGEYRESIAAARAMLERLEAAEKDKETIDKDKDFAKHLEGMKSWSKAKRIQFLRRALRTLCDAASHADDHTVGIEWHRRDATAIVQFQSGLLRMLSKQ